MSLFNPSRSEARQFFFEAWRKHRDGEVLSPLEAMAAQVIAAHEEYHAILEAPERGMEQEYFPAMGETNPFLHLGLHLSVLEQISIDQPPGIAVAYRTLAARLGDLQAAQHMLMECLAETLWRAQRQGNGPDAAGYLDCVQRSLRRTA